ncbi:hypothetical protein D9619_004071 [Psilocybe cf. subviscida]|uniref:Uncharacterized protein n=1 Tax=Psilocybe cf. subviscida TaxID=2480587 RepID=A0A8H5BRS7_9AGAR|nr:hypothetical protein D9619_004071 [Psilocybe cf. subviscida]
MTGSGTQKNNIKPSKDGPPATSTRSSEQQVKTKADAMASLKAAKIISPTTEITSLSMLSEVLLKHALSLTKQGQQSIAYTPLTDKKVLEAIAVLIQHYSESSIMELVNESVQAAMGNVAEQLQNAMKEELTKIRKENAEASTSVVDMAKQVHSSLNKVADGAPSYSKMAASGTGGANPSFIARQAIHVRQFLFKMVDAEGFAGNGKDNASICDTAQKAIANMEAPVDVRVRTVSKNDKRQELLMEMTTEAGADWLRAEGRMARLEHVLGSKLRNRIYQVMVKFVPISFNPETEDQEVLSENGIEVAHLISMRWIKPLERRREDQRFAHLMLTFNDAQSANNTIIRGVVIQGRRRATEKCKKEALRCLKCHTSGNDAKS